MGFLASVIDFFHKKCNRNAVTRSLAFNKLALSYDPESLVSVIRIHCIGLVDTEILARYPVIQRNFSYQEITNASVIAVLRSFVFIEHSYVGVHMSTIVSETKNILGEESYNMLWDSITFFQQDNFPNDKIIQLSQVYNIPIQGVIINMCAEWLFRYLTQNDMSVDSAFALDRISRSIAALYL